MTPPDNIPVNDSVVEFGFRLVGATITADLLTSGVVTLQYEVQNFAAVTYTLRSTAFADATNFTVLTNSFEGVSLSASLVGDTLTISVGGVPNDALRTLTYSIQLEFPPEVSGRCCVRFSGGPAQRGFVWQQLQSYGDGECKC